MCPTANFRNFTNLLPNLTWNTNFLQSLQFFFVFALNIQNAVNHLVVTKSESSILQIGGKKLSTLYSRWLTAANYIRWAKRTKNIVASHTHDVDSKNALHAVKQTLQPQSNLSPRHESRNPGHVELAGIQNEVLAKNLQVFLSTPPSKRWKKTCQTKIWREPLNVWVFCSTL